MLQALVQVALSSRVHHPNIVPVLGVAEYPSTQDLLLVSTESSTIRIVSHASCSKHTDGAAFRFCHMQYDNKHIDDAACARTYLKQQQMKGTPDFI